MQSIVSDILGFVLFGGSTVLFVVCAVCLFFGMHDAITSDIYRTRVQRANMFLLLCATQSVVLYLTYTFGSITIRAILATM